MFEFLIKEHGNSDTVEGIMATLRNDMNRDMGITSKPKFDGETNMADMERSVEPFKVISLLTNPKYFCS